jgi:hypothetical protein
MYTERGVQWGSAAYKLDLSATSPRIYTTKILQSRVYQINQETKDLNTSQELTRSFKNALPTTTRRTSNNQRLG